MTGARQAFLYAGVEDRTDSVAIAACEGPRFGQATPSETRFSAPCSRRGVCMGQPPGIILLPLQC